jgi:hypothetical protein
MRIAVIGPVASYTLGATAFLSRTLRTGGDTRSHEMLFRFILNRVKRRPRSGSSRNDEGATSRLWALGLRE